MDRAVVMAKNLAAPDRAALVERAVGLLDDGAIIVVPTESRYLALGRDPSVFTGPAWVADSASRVLAETKPAVRAHRRLIRRLCPGPAVFLLEADGADSGATVRFQAPKHELTGQILAAAAARFGRVWGESIVELGWPTDRRAPQTPGDKVGLVIDDGNPALTKPPTVIRLTADGYEIEHPGAYEERFIAKQLRRVILFVCTGNTCRSPMAEAIARHLLAERQDADDGGFVTEVVSAGVAAGAGTPASQGAVDALGALGIEAGEHLSRRLTRRLIEDAELIYVMTRAHEQSVLALDPAASPKLMLLDPDGGEVDDPVGGAADIYEQTARRLRGLIARRLEEAEP